MRRSWRKWLNHANHILRIVLKTHNTFQRVHIMAMILT